MAKTAGFVFFAFWFAFSAVFTVPMLLYGAAALSADPAPWNFPGDPPVFEWLFISSGIATVLNTPVWLAGRFIPRLNDLFRSLPRLFSILSAAALVVSGAGILERHDARWSEVRSGIQRYGDAIAAAAGDGNRVLSDEEFTKFKRDIMPASVPAQLRGYGTVTLRVASGIYPYVIVDFGRGASALFDPTTMICKYSD